KGEPYVVAGDVYDRTPHAGRAGWTWYTGSAGWLYRAGLESLLGLKARGSVFAVDPCIPAGWGSCSIAWRYRSSRYDIVLSNPNRYCRGVASAHLDDAPVDASAIPLVDDRQTHTVRVVLGPRLRS